MNSRGLQDTRPRASRFVRIGQRLVDEGLLTVEQLNEAVSAQVEQGVRFGSVLVDLGHLDVDTLAQCLGRWYGMPPALQSDFSQCDMALADRLPPALAAKHGAVPLGRLGGTSSRWVAVAVMDPPTPAVVQTLARTLGCLVIPAIAADPLLRRGLQDIYGVAPLGRAADVRMAPPLEFLDDDPPCEFALTFASSVSAQPPANQPRAVSVADEYPSGDESTGLVLEQEIELDFESDVDDTRATGNHVRIPGFLRVAQTPKPAVEDGDEVTLRRRAYPSKIPPQPQAGDDAAADSADDEAKSSADTDELNRQAVPQPMPEIDSSRSTNPVALGTLGRISLRRMKTAPPERPVESEFAPAETVDDFLRAVRRATGRERVAELTVGALRDLFDQIFDVGIMLDINGLFAVGWKGFIRSGRNASAEAITLPLRAQSAIGAACRNRRPYLGPVPDGGTDMDRRIWTILEVEPPLTVAVAPLLLDTDAACVVYAHSAFAPDQVAAIVRGSFGALAGAAAAAFERLARAAER